MLDELLAGKLSAVENRFEELTAKLSDPVVLAQTQVMQKLAKEHSDLRELVETFRTHRDVSRRMAEARECKKIRRCASWPAPKRTSFRLSRGDWKND